MRKSLSEIVTQAGQLKSHEDKVAFLKANDSEALRSIFVIVYDPKTYKWNIPTEAPNYSASKITESQGALYRQVRKLRYLIEGFDGGRLQQYRREYLFREILETVDARDAELLIQMLAQKPFKGIAKKVVTDAFPNLIAEKAPSDGKAASA